MSNRRKWEIERCERAMERARVAENIAVIFDEATDDEHNYTRNCLAQLVVDSFSDDDTQQPTWSKLTIRQDDKDFMKIYRIGTLFAIFSPIW